MRDILIGRGRKIFVPEDCLHCGLFQTALHHLAAGRVAQRVRVHPLYLALLHQGPELCSHITLIGIRKGAFQTRCGRVLGVVSVQRFTVSPAVSNVPRTSLRAVSATYGLARVLPSLYTLPLPFGRRRFFLCCGADSGCFFPHHGQKDAPSGISFRQHGLTHFMAYSFFCPIYPKAPFSAAVLPAL